MNTKMATLITTALVIVAGAISREATLAQFETDLDKEIANRENDHERISEAVDVVFDTYKGARINLPALASYVLTELAVPPAAWSDMQERVCDYVRSVSGDRASGAKLGMGKGRKGGVTRHSDQPAEVTSTPEVTA